MEIYFDVNEWKLVVGLVEGWGIFVIFGYYRKLLSGLDCRLRIKFRILILYFNINFCLKLCDVYLGINGLVRLYVYY